MKSIKHSLAVTLVILFSGSISAQLNNGVNTLTNNSGSAGNNNTGSGSYSFSTGINNQTTGSFSSALGIGNTSYHYSLAAGGYSSASGIYSLALGRNATAQGIYSRSIGLYSDAIGNYSFAMGDYLRSSAQQSFVIGRGINNANKLENTISNSLMIGFNSNVPSLFVGPSSGAGTTGNVGIGTTKTNGYKLSVEGKMRAREIEVNADVWADYVFDKDYKLIPLAEVEKFIQENNHLPNIPSAKEVVEEGLNLGEMQVKMMEKIEELTLYIIEVKKENELLKIMIENK